MKTISKSELLLADNNGILNYMEHLSLGSGIVHPDIVLRMKELCHKLEGMSLRKYKNSVIIKITKKTCIVAVAFGTAYSIRTGKMFKTAINIGTKTTHNWSDGSSLNLIETFGPDWVVGSWHRDEECWIESLNT